MVILKVGFHPTFSRHDIATLAMKTRMNERIERYLPIEMWKFQSQQRFLSCVMADKNHM